MMFITGSLPLKERTTLDSKIIYAKINNDGFIPSLITLVAAVFYPTFILLVGIRARKLFTQQGVGGTGAMFAASANSCCCVDVNPGRVCPISS